MRSENENLISCGRRAKEIQQQLRRRKKTHSGSGKWINRGQLRREGRTFFLSFYLGARVKHIHILSSLVDRRKKASRRLVKPIFPLSLRRRLLRVLLKTIETQLVVLFSSNKAEQVTRYFMMIELNFDGLILHFDVASCGECDQETEQATRTTIYLFFATSIIIGILIVNFSFRSFII